MDRDIEKLRVFVSKVYDWLRACYLGDTQVNEPEWPVIDIHPKIARRAPRVWREFEKEYPLEELLKPLDPKRKDLEGILKAHGLHGAQLSYKLRLVDLAATKSLGITGWRRKLIDLIDNVIDSLNPVGIAGALKELKDALKGNLPDK